MAQRVLYNNNGRADSITLQPSSVDLGNVTNDLQIPKSIVTAKGDIITATANATPVRQGVGNNGQIIIADSNLTNGIGYKDPSFRNWVINGNMEVAQRGTSFTSPASGTYTLDRWKISSVSDGGTQPSNIIHSQQILTSGDIFGSFNFYRVNPDGAGTSFGNNSRYIVYTGIEGGVKNLCGADKKITVSFYARSSIANKKIGIYISPYYGTGGTPSSQEFIYGDKYTLSSNWTKYSHTFETNTLVDKVFGTSNNDVMYFGFFYQWGSSYAEYVGDTVAETFVGSGNIDIAQVALYAGDVAYPFEPVPFDVELQRCMRYYEKSYKYSVAPGTANDANGMAVISSHPTAYYGDISIPFKVKKRLGTPTIQSYSYDGATSAGTTNCRYWISGSGVQTDGTISNISDNSFSFSAGTSHINTKVLHWTCESDF